MLTSPCYVISDTHLGFAPGSVERAVVSFCRHVAEQPGASLLINGDLFEFWFEWRTVIPRRGFRVLAALADVVDAGIPVTMIAGNHDCWGGDVLRRDAGIDYQFGPWVGDLGGWRAKVDHGDGLRPRADRRYRLLRRLLRNRLAIRSFRWVHPDIATRIAAGSSNTSRTYAARDGGLGLREAAMRAAGEDEGLQLIVFGHSHVATLERLPASGSVYANPGSWLDAPTFLRVTPDRVSLRRWEDSAESPDLHTIHRSTEEALPEL